MGVDIRKTKIVATLGPSSGSHEMVRALARAGMDAVRLNFSHGTLDEHAARIGVARAVQAELGRPLALIADLQGPKLRLGELATPRVLIAHETVVLAEPASALDGDLTVSPAAIAEVLTPGDDVLIDDGHVRLVVETRDATRVRCRVVVGGTVTSHKGVNLPGVSIPVPSLTEKDRIDLDFALGLGVDYVALSFVRSADDVRELKEIIRERGSDARVIAKIEKAEAIDELDAVIDEADAVMVARGDLGVEMSAAMVPLLQKRIILRALEAGKPVITATQMLESMVEHAEPTRAEASDVANAILDGTSAVMLSAETAVGAYPVAAIETMDQIARAVEPSLGFRLQTPEHDGAARDVRRALSNSATHVAEMLDAKAILVATATGVTASEVARHRPRRPMVGLSHHQTWVQQMALEWGVLPLLMASTSDVEELWEITIETSRRAGIIDEGDLVVLVGGTVVNLTGSTNVIKVDVA